MFNPNKLAEVVLDEARLLASRYSFDNDAITSPDDMLKALCKYGLLPNATQIAALVEPLFWASLLTEEGQPTSFCTMVLDPDDTENRYLPLLRFQEPIIVTPRSVKKLTPAHDPENSYLEVFFNEDCPYIHGMARLRTEPNSASDLFSVRSLTPGTVDIACQAQRLVRFHQGRIDRLSEALITRSRLSDWFKDLFPSLLELSVLVDPIVRSISEHGHGGSIWVLESSKDLPPEVRLQYAIAPAAPVLKAMPRRIERRAWNLCKLES